MPAFAPSQEQIDAAAAAVAAMPDFGAIAEAMSGDTFGGGGFFNVPPSRMPTSSSFLPTITRPDPGVNPAQPVVDIILRGATALGGLIFGRGPGEGETQVRLPPRVGGVQASTDVFHDPGPIITIPPAIIRRIPVPSFLPWGNDPRDDDPFWGSRPGFDWMDIPDVVGRVLGNVREPFGGFGGEGPIQYTNGGASQGGTQVANGACPPARARMPSSIMADDPCSPNNPTIYIKAGKASSLISPQLISSQSRKLSRANKAIPKKVVRRKKK